MRGLAAAALLLGAARAAALSGTEAGAAAAPFLALGAGARSLGMGEAAVASAEGAEAAFANPAGLARARTGEVAYARAELPGSVHHDFAALALPLPRAGGVLGAWLSRLSEPSLERRDSLGRAQGGFSAHSEAAALAFALDLVGEAPRRKSYYPEPWEDFSPRRRAPRRREPPRRAPELSAGLSLGAVSETIAERRAAAAFADLGAAWRPPGAPGLTLAAAARRLGSRLRFAAKAAELPAEAAAGAAWRREGAAGGRLTLAAEASVPRLGAPRGAFGAEWERPVSAGASAALRAGWDSRPAGALGPAAGLTMGAGFRAGAFSFDAAFRPLGALGGSLRLGLAWRFGGATGSAR